MDASSGLLAVSVLGPLEVSAGERPVELRTRRVRALVAMLAMSAGRPVSVDRLAVGLWDDAPPGNARRSVQTYLARLRTALGADRIGSGPAGYQLCLEPERVDALRFGRLLDAAAQAPDPAAERALVEQALSLWRGLPFDGVHSTWLERAVAPRLHERYLAAVERRIDLDLAEGHDGELVPQLYELTARNPLRESLWVRLLVVLDRSGRPAEALERYEQVRVRLAEELGTDPGPELRRAYADLLAGGSPRGPARPEPAPAGSPVPRQLPADIDGFTGRHAELKQLNNLIGAGQERPPGAVVISAIAGTAGIGKTALAVHWAHQVADRFPDGQLYVNLRGFHPTGAPTDPAEAVRGFVDALGVPPAHQPAHADAQVGLYRSLLSGKRMLIVLDNARDSEQVRPLLPGSPTCLVVVTSRNQLTGLVATDAARPVTLDLLTPDEARQLLANRLGCDRVAAEPAATDEVVARCARLPLALAIAGAWASTRSHLPLATIAALLHDGQSRLDALSADDPMTNARAVFSWSYRALTAAAARLFRLFALHPGPDLGAPAAASLAGLALPQARTLLAELTGAHLLTETVPGRYTGHDLLRAYAAELLQAHEPEPGRRAAYHRLLDHYLHTGHAAARLLKPHRITIATGEPLPGVTTVPLADTDGAIGWFAAEDRTVLSIIDGASRGGCETYAWQIAWAVSDYFARRGPWLDWKAAQLTVLDAVRRAGDRTGQALTLCTLGLVNTYLGQFDEAEADLATAVDLYRRLGDVPGQTLAHAVRSELFGRLDRHAEALAESEQMLELFRAAGDAIGEAKALNAVGWDHAQLGNHQQALHYCAQALVLHQRNGNPIGEAATWDSLAYAHHHLGRHTEAIDCYQRALDVFRTVDARYPEADTLIRLGETQVAAGDPEAAHATWQQSLALLEELHHPDAGQVRENLAALGRPG